MFAYISLLQSGALDELTTAAAFDSLSLRMEATSVCESRSTVSISELQQNTAGVLQRLHASQAPMFILEMGHTSAVLLSAEAYEKTEHDRELLGLLAQGERDIAAGLAFELDSVLREADAMLKEEE